MLATHNAGKVAELHSLLADLKVECIAAASVDLVAPVETGVTYAENACLKAQAASRACGLPCLGDDSGLGVDVLDGAPGVHTGRYAKQQGGWPAARVALKLACGLRDSGLPAVRAALHCALAIAQPNADTVCVTARIRGILVWPPQASLPGFVAMFKPDHGVVEERAVLVHRRAAFAALLKLYPLSLSKLTR